MITALPWLPLPLLGVAMMMMAPLFGPQLRRRIAWIFVAFAVAAGAVALWRSGATARLDVVNAFPKGDEGALKALVFQQVEVAGWCAPAWAAVMFGLNALWVVTRWGGAGAPSIIRHALDAFGWVLFLRLGWELTAAPAGLVWATGTSMMMIPIAALQGVYSGRLRLGFGRLVVAVFVVALLWRISLSGVSLLLTEQGWGTHLDVSSLDGFESRFLDEPVVFGEDRFEKWWKAVAIPQVLMWVPAQFLLGLLAAAVGRRLTRPAVLPASA